MSTGVVFPSPSYIVVAGGGGGSLEGQRLTAGEDGHVTLGPPSAVPDIAQEWNMKLGDEGKITISRPSDSLVATPVSTSTILTYDGAPGAAKQGDRIVLNGFPSASEWRARIDPGPIVRFRVPDTELGIAIATPGSNIYPPILELSVKDQLEWEFIAVRPPR